MIYFLFFFLLLLLLLLLLGLVGGTTVVTSFSMDGAINVADADTTVFSTVTVSSLCSSSEGGLMGSGGDCVMTAGGAPPVLEVELKSLSKLVESLPSSSISALPVSI